MVTLEQARRLNNISRKKVSEELGVNESTIYRWEKGKSTPDAHQFIAMCKMYGYHMDDIFVPSRLAKS